MDEKILKMKEEIESKLSNVSDLLELDKLRVGYLGKKGSITSLLKGMKDLAAEQKKAFGADVNKLKEFSAEMIEKKAEELKKLQVEHEIKSMPVFDISAPSKYECGSYHPITLVQRQCETIFKSMGFTVEDYSEALNLSISPSIIRQEICRILTISKTVSSSNHRHQPHRMLFSENTVPTL